MQDKLPYVNMQHTYNMRYIYANMQQNSVAWWHNYLSWVD